MLCLAYSAVYFAQNINCIELVYKHASDIKSCLIVNVKDKISVCVGMVQLYSLIMSKKWKTTDERPPKLKALWTKKANRKQDPSPLCMTKYP